jgi:serine/threonine protein kinase/Tfp pilus assembly protein PilF
VVLYACHRLEDALLMEGFSHLSRVARFGSFELDRRAGELRKQGLRIRLPEQSFQILVLLLEHPGELVAREEIQAKLWPHDTVVEFDHSINTAIRRLRDALNDSADQPRFVETLARRGYRFIAPVEWVQPTPAEGAPTAPKSPASSLPETAESEAGRQVSHYRILQELGRGGMGVVYKAQDTRLGRLVALKFLPKELAADPQALERFRREARAASTLDHPNICTIYEIDEAEGQPFIAMQFLEGRTLKEHLTSRALPPDELLEIAVQIAEALQAAHANGIVHRDIKPSNIFLTQHGRLKVLDFGLAKLLPARQPKAVAGSPAPAAPVEELTSPGTAMGTLAYMSPEQLRGEPVDERGDIFSLGVLLYEALTGRLPFRGENPVDLQYAILHQAPTPLRSLLPDVSPAWEQLLECCLAKAPDQRYASLAEVLAALRRTAGSAVPAQKSVAVLYFENVSEAKEDEYFRDGITEDIITELSKIGELWVCSRSSVLAYRDKRLTAAQVGQQLGAAYVLEGSLRRSGNRLRLTAQLVETRTARSVWAERYDRQWQDVFAIQDEIAQSVAGALRVMLSEQERRAIAKVPTADVQAYDYYLRGRQFFHLFRGDSLGFARQMFTRAIETDPNYTRAYAGIADCCSFLYMYFESTDANLREADSASRRALELDPDLAEAHAARGLAVALNKRYDEAAQEFETAIRLNPRLFEAYYFYGRALHGQGKMEQAAEMFRKACDVNPDDYQTPHFLAMALRALGRPEEGRAADLRGLRVVERHVQMHPDDSRALLFGATQHLQAGHREKCLEWVGRALAITPDEPITFYNAACNYSLAGEVEEAIRCLEKAITSGMAQKDWIAHDSDLDPIRGHPRFQELLRRMKPAA